MTEPVTWLKRKHSAPKGKGRYKSTHNDQGNKKRSKKGVHVKLTRERILTLTAAGKRSWSWRAL